ncbi:hypothetical protein Scep_026594 [Stephania cephalantha]|uniref:MSP domain-containing protein n=1 Tax=Stephania cephalantha TaxID=152367 RepID=A0AAP0EKF2_9MAGN
MNGDGRRLITIQPEDLTFLYELEKQSHCDLRIANKTEHHVAFKVKTTSPKKYFVRPNTGVIQPWDACTVTVTLQAQREYPPDMQCKDKFLLQSAVVPPNTDVDELPQDTFNKDSGKVIDECKLKVIYTTPSSGNENSEDETPLKASREIFDANIMRTVQHLKEERDVAFEQTRQLQRELDLLRRRRNRNNDQGFSLAFAAFVGLVGIVLGFLLNLMFSAPPAE